MLGTVATEYTPTKALYFFPILIPRTTLPRAKVHNLELNLISSSNLVSKKLVLSGRSPNTMTRSITTGYVSRGSRSSSSSGEEQGIKAIDQEDSFLVNESSGFRPDVALAGLQSTLNDLSKWLMVALFCLVILSRHDAKAIWLTWGAIMNVGLSVTLKQILNQERPLSATKSDPGMPSSHAQSIFFINFIFILSIMEWLGVNGLTTTIAVVALALGLYFTWLRVSEGFHTLSQVFVGGTVGSIFAISWFWMWSAFVLEAFNSYLWLRVLLVFGGVGMVLLFTVFIIQHWIIKEN